MHRVRARAVFVLTGGWTAAVSAADGTFHVRLGPSYPLSPQKRPDLRCSLSIDVWGRFYPGRFGANDLENGVAIRKGTKKHFFIKILSKLPLGRGGAVSDD